MDLNLRRNQTDGAEQAVEATAEGDIMDILKEKYGKVYRVVLSLEPDDDSEVELEYWFLKPKTPSYDRYVKSMSNSPTKAAKAFILDNVVKEDEARLKQDLEEYPALCFSVAEKLLSILGLSKTTNLKML